VGAGQTLTRDQFAALAEQLRPDDRLLVVLLRWSGLRIAEALGLAPWPSFGGLGLALST
jgi:integrase